MSELSNPASSMQLPNILGQPLKVLVQASHSDMRIQAEVFGHTPGRYVALHSSGRRPNASLSTLELRIGDELTVRFLFDGIAYAFTSDVTHLSAHPEPLTFLRYPQAVAQVSVRRYRRLACRLPCNLLDPTGVRIPALLLDISEGGGKVAIRGFQDDDSATRAVVTIELNLPSSAGGVHQLAGEVIRTDGQESTVLAGIRFERPQTEVVQSLSTYLCLDNATRAPLSTESSAAGA